MISLYWPKRKGAPPEAPYEPKAHVIVSCDETDCETVYIVEKWKTLDEARDYASAAGWQCTATHDYCGKHAKAQETRPA